jgi:hypothetical protein
MSCQLRRALRKTHSSCRLMTTIAAPCENGFGVAGLLTPRESSFLWGGAALRSSVSAISNIDSGRERYTMARIF